jgi:hypothetical protein
MLFWHRKHVAPQEGITIMEISSLMVLVAGLGAAGGIVNCAITGEFIFPKFDSATRIWRPGWVGNVLVGGAAATVVFGMNGPLASFDLFARQQPEMHFTVAQLISSIVVGLGGGNILTQFAQKQAERFSKNTLASTLSALIGKTPTTP